MTENLVLCKHSRESISPRLADSLAGREAGRESECFQSVQRPPHQTLPASRKVQPYGTGVLKNPEKGIPEKAKETGAREEETRLLS